MKKYIALLALVVCCSKVAQATHNPQEEQRSSPGSQWAFRENKGQVTDQFGTQRSDIQFQLSSNGSTVFIGKGNIHYQWDQTERPGAAVKVVQKYAPPVNIVNTYRMDVELLGCDKDASIIEEQRLPDPAIFYGQNPDGIRAYAYRKITYRNIYPGIDWVLYIKDKVLKYDFIVRPEGKVSDIRIRYQGATGINITEEKLVALTPVGRVTEEKPFSYLAGSGRSIPTAFVLNHDVVSFTTAQYEGTLIIDPELRLEWATYYGGIAPEPADAGVNGGDLVADNNAMAATDNKGNVYVTGTTMSSENIATTGSFQSTRNNASNVFLVKFNSRGQRLWATYYGGSAANYASPTSAGSGHAIACDTTGHVYLTGCTWNPEGITTPNAYQVNKGGIGNTIYWPDLFLAKFDEQGNRQWATYYGGTQAEGGGSVAVTPDGNNIYLAGSTDPGAQTNFNVVSPNAAIPYSGTTTNMPQSGFLARFNSSGQRVWGTYIHPTTKGHTIVMDIALDPQGFIFLSGSSHADPGAFTPTDTSIVTWGSFQQYNNSPDIYGRDAFLQKWDSAGGRLWGTFYGGGGYRDIGSGVTCDDAGNVYLTGSTNSDFGFTHGLWCIATQGSYKETYSNTDCAFLVKFNGAGQRQWGTYFTGYGGALAAAGENIYLTGRITENGLATPCAYQEDYGGGNTFNNAGDGFLAQFNTSGYPDYITYFGGEAPDGGSSLAVSDWYGRNAVYLAGGTKSHQRIATPGSHKDLLIGNESDVFLAKFFSPYTHEIIACFKEDSILIRAIDTSGTHYQWNNSDTGYSLWVKTSGWYTVSYQQKPGCVLVDSFLVHIYPLPELSVIKDCPGKGKAIVKTTYGNRYTYAWYDAAGNLLQQRESDEGDSLSDLPAGGYSLKIQTPAGCDTDLYFTIEAYPPADLSLSNDTLIPARSSVTLWATGAVQYQWYPEKWLDNALIPTPTASPHEAVTYYVTGSTEYGCTATDSVRIGIMENLFIPNAFSPNGDGANDEFKMVNYGYQQLREFRVFNRWGELVFWTVNPDKGWDGTYKGGPADLGAYSYYIRLAERGGQERVFKGDVTLMR